jgi:hypothetical protein
MICWAITYKKKASLFLSKYVDNKVIDNGIKRRCFEGRIQILNLP